MAEHTHLVILGDPGSGKTTLLRYLTLCYGRDCAEDTTLVQERLGLRESRYLPLLLPLRNLGAYLKAHHTTTDGTEGHRRLLDFVQAYLRGENISLPEQDFEAELAAGHVVLFFDGMDEVGDVALRHRVARLIEQFASAYPTCRLVVTSRLVGYTGAARLGDDFVTTTICDFREVPAQSVSTVSSRHLHRRRSTRRLLIIQVPAQHFETLHLWSTKKLQGENCLVVPERLIEIDPLPTALAIWGTRNGRKF